MEVLLAAVTPYFVQLMGALSAKYGFVIQLLTFIGLFRLILKPFLVFIHSYVAVTETKKDDEFIEKVEGNKIFKGLLFVLDWLASIKIIK